MAFGDLLAVNGQSDCDLLAIKNRHRLDVGGVRKHINDPCTTQRIACVMTQNLDVSC